MKQKIHGSWDLKSFDIIGNDGVRRPWGDNTKGLLIYVDTGEVSVSINRSLDSEEPDAVLDSILFYSGTYSVEGNVVKHDVQLASSPTRVGKEMIRFADLEGDELTLKTPKESYGIAELVWQRRSL